MKNLGHESMMMRRGSIITIHLLIALFFISCNSFRIVSFEGNFTGNENYQGPDFIAKKNEVRCFTEEEIYGMAEIACQRQTINKRGVFRINQDIGVTTLKGCEGFYIFSMGLAFRNPFDRVYYALKSDESLAVAVNTDSTKNEEVLKLFFEKYGSRISYDDSIYIHSNFMAGTGFHDNSLIQEN